MSLGWGARVPCTQFLLKARLPPVPKPGGQVQSVSVLGTQGLWAGLGAELLVFAGV